MKSAGLFGLDALVLAQVAELNGQAIRLLTPTGQKYPTGQGNRSLGDGQ